MWSGPRNISTAMMRAWESRADTAVMDEPFYGAYLQTTGFQHPMRDAVLTSCETDWDAAARRCAEASDAPIIYQKHMCQHMVEGAPLDWMVACRHAFLIRPPEEVAPSFAKGWPDMVEDSLGFARQAALFDRVAEMTGQTPPVVEARDVLADPAGLLRALCDRLDVDFDPAMLSWAAGPRESDGVWGAHWYASVRASTRFQAPRCKESPDLPPALAEIVIRAQPHYEKLHRHKIMNNNKK